MFAESFHMLHIELALAFFLSQSFASSFSQVEGLIRADIELVRTEKRAVLVDQSLDKIQSIRMGNIQRVVLARISVAVGDFLGIRQFAELATGLGAENPVHMAETGKGGHQLDMADRAVSIQLHNLLGRQRGILSPGLRKSPEKIGMLDVELPLFTLNRQSRSATSFK